MGPEHDEQLTLPGAELTDDSDASAEPEGPTRAELEAIQRRLDEADRRAEEANARAETANRALETIAKVGATPQRQEAPQDTVGPMPDALRDPEGFNNWLARREDSIRQSAVSEAQRIADSSRAENESVQDRVLLWQEFQSEYPEFSNMMEAAKVAFLLETNGTAQIPSDRNAFKKRIAKRMEDMKSGFISKSGDPSTDSSRTEDVSGGSHARKPKTKKSNPEPKTKSLADAFRDWQDSTPFF